MTQPGTSAPDGSRTVPRIVPNVDWISAPETLGVRVAITRIVSAILEIEKVFICFLPAQGMEQNFVTMVRRTGTRDSARKPTQRERTKRRWKMQLGDVGLKK